MLNNSAKKESHFRSWVRNIWFDNAIERAEYKQLPYTMEEYYQKYKWWLKREYKFQNKQKSRT